MEREVKRRLMLNKWTGIIPVHYTNQINKNNLDDFIKAILLLGFEPPATIVFLDDNERKLLLHILSEISGQNIDWENTTFYESFKYVNVTNEEILRIQQIVHYITRYLIPSISGEPFKYEDVYIPKKFRDTTNLKTSKIREFKKIVIRDIKEVEKLFFEKIVYSNIPLSTTDIFDIVNFIINYGYNVEFERIKNRNLKVVLLDKYTHNDIVNVKLLPEEILMYVSYKYLGSLIFTKNKYFREKLKYVMKIYKAYEDRLKILKMILNLDREQFLKSYKQHRKIWKIVIRFIKPEKFKDIICKYNSQIKLRDLTHTDKVIKEESIITDNRKFELGYYNEIPSNLYVRRLCELNDIDTTILNKADIKTLVAAYNSIVLRKALKENGIEIHEILIRNGKKHILTEGNYFNNIKDDEFTNKLLDVIKRKVNDKLNKLGIEYLNEIEWSNMEIPLVTTFRFAAGNLLPYTIINLNKDINRLVFGIHWVDKNEHERTDIDLSATVILPNKTYTVSWNTNFKDGNDGLKIIHSGDMTVAPPPKGASELIYISNVRNTYAFFDVRIFASLAKKIDSHIIVTTTDYDLDTKDDVKMVETSNSILNLQLTLSPEQSGFNILYTPENKLIILPKVNVSSIYVMDDEYKMIKQYAIYQELKAKYALKLRDVIELPVYNGKIEKKITDIELVSKML